MSERLQKVIAQAGLASRRHAEDLITNGMVTVNGYLVTELGTKVDPERDHIEVEGKRLTKSRAARKVYAIYKPKSCMTTLSDPQGRPTIVDYFPKIKERLFPVGRLDWDAEGLILVTNDGDFANRLMHPAAHIWKEYLVKVKGNIPPGLLKKMEPGPVVEGKTRMPCKLRLLHHKGDKSWLVVELQEGIKNQIKLMFREVGFPVLKIKRYRIGSVELLDMRPGQCRRLSEGDLHDLLELGEL
ncbi:MAG: pseudouridine synthase [Candidatus Lambdaproteobacteria bacterium RIFOXYD2_FULL_50_16]|uniref:Pseudouridine synthase n=1 Tax=Candidatus Lambdaproteobacteria bacterium RIFOXYD2_FULL_50_16 TaxID=1817772 RepID=A0A1F6GF69_9PROT|nr:MAG: pseudouridine synthase [Candidatus Lambdaproteobacteria bacterium RIFOXYD2_FULL_50_16]